MITVLRELQSPFLGLILLVALATKLAKVLRARSVLVVLDATQLFPPRVRHACGVMLCLTELFLCVGLLATAWVQAGWWSIVVHAVGAAFFGVGMCALAELREKRPDLGCGCFGELSSSSPGVRSIARCGMLSAMALAGIGTPALRLPPPGPAAAAVLGIFLTEVLLLAAMSPEVSQGLAKLGYTEPCERRPMTLERATAILRRSRTWRENEGKLADEPSDVWRELCWWYLAYPGNEGVKEPAVVFAVEVKHRRPAVHAAPVGDPADDPPGELLSAPTPLVFSKTL